MTEHVVVEAFVEEGEPILVVPASHWRLLCWLHAELAWEFKRQKTRHAIHVNSIQVRE